MAAFNENATPSVHETVRLGSEATSSSSAQQLPSPNSEQVEPQLFTPTTKNILEQIGEGCSQAMPLPTNTHTPVAERPICFGTVTTEDSEGAGSADLDHLPGKIVESPKKKKTKGWTRISRCHDL